MKPTILQTAVCATVSLASATFAGTEPQEVQVPDTPPPPLTNLVWKLPPKYATLDGGRLVVDERPGCEPATGAKWWFGTIPAGAPAPTAKGRWRVVRRPSPTPGVDDLWLVYGKSTLMIVR